jgi:ABC-2 type transport system ATP-binding protein
MSAIHVEQVSKRFGSVIALNNLSLDVGDGELVGLIGADGAGKTTLFRVLTTLMLPDSGRATVLGLDVTTDLWELRARLGYMPGRFALYTDLSVEENLAFFASVFGTTIEAGYDAIAPIYRQLEPFKARRAGALSGGMKQKLALCCALVHHPDLLLLDEPTTGVDAVSRREFWDLLGTLRASGLTILVATPYMDEAARCDRVALMQQGQILAMEAPAQVGRRFPRALFGVQARERAALLDGLRSIPTAASVYPFGETVHYSDARANVGADVVMGDVSAALTARGLSDVRVQPIAPSIEDVFIELMGVSPSLTEQLA